MIGAGYWATGITVEFFPSAGCDGGWAASLNFVDDGFCSDEPSLGIVSTEGTLRTRYFVHSAGSPDGGLPTALDVLIADAARLGITFRRFPDNEPMIYYRGDGEDPDHEPPDGWLALLTAEANRLGWSTYRRADGAA